MAALQEEVQVEPARCEARNIVIVTGFGPFKNHPVNASWEAVKLLPTTGIDKELGICLVTEQIPVAYEDVTAKVPTLWKSHKPLLVIHVGVSHLARKITLETKACKSGYEKCDVAGKTPENKECCLCSATELQTGLDIEELNNSINATSTAVETELSQNAGRYLCEFIYYVSLSIDRSRAIFIHVPPLDNPYSAAQLTQGLADIIRCLVNQLRSRARQEPSA